MDSKEGKRKKQKASSGQERLQKHRTKKKFNEMRKFFTSGDVFGIHPHLGEVIMRGMKTFVPTFDEIRPWLKTHVNNECPGPLPIDESNKAKWDEIMSKMKDMWDAAEPLENKEYPDLMSACKELLRKDGDCLVDPPLTDVMNHTIWMKFVPQDVRDNFQFKNTSGDGWIYNEETKLWKAVDQKQMSMYIFRVAQQHFENAPVNFTTPKQEAYWRSMICNATTYNGLINLLKGHRMYPNPMEQDMDKKAWLIPCQNGQVFDAKEAKLRPRDRTDYFTQETSFEYLSDGTGHLDDDDEIVINDTKTREELFQNFHKKSPENIINVLWSLCPNAMDWIGNTFNDPDRLWFVLTRLGAVLSGFCIREVMFVYGPGKGGKSTLFQTITEICGDLGIVLMKSSFIKNKMESGASHRSDLKRAVGRRIAIVDELESSDCMNETLLKNWASHQKIPMREIYGKQAEDTLRSFLIFLTNEPPRFSQEDTTIRERVRAVRVVTKYFDKECPPNEKPSAFTTEEEWKDGYSEAEDTNWIYRSPAKEKAWRAFKESKEKQNELGTLLCLVTAIAYRLTKEGVSMQLPLPQKIVADSKRFFEESDVVENFLNEFYEDCKNYDNAVTLKDMYDKFKQTFPDLGIKSFTLQTFKRSLAGKNLIFPNARNRAVKVKKALRGHGNGVYVS